MLIFRRQGYVKNDLTWVCDGCGLELQVSSKTAELPKEWETVRTPSEHGMLELAFCGSECRVNALPYAWKPLLLTP